MKRKLDLTMPLGAFQSLKAELSRMRQYLDLHSFSQKELAWSKYPLRVAKRRGTEASLQMLSDAELANTEICKNLVRNLIKQNQDI